MQFRRNRNMRSEATAFPQQSILRAQHFSNIEFTLTRKAPDEFSDKVMGGRDHTNVTNFSIQSGEGESSFFCKSVWNMQFVK